ncbi:SCRB5 family protein [Megaselia abdita]
MKNLSNLFTQDYSVVGTCYQYNSKSSSYVKNRKKSLKASRVLNQNFNLIESLFKSRSSSQNLRVPTGSFVLLVAGIFLITTGIIIKCIHPYDAIFKWKLVFGPDGEIFNLWRNPPVDLYIKIYLFNITNSEMVLAGKEKINVQEIGPYVYKELMTHDNVNFNKNGTVSTIPKHPLVWQEHLSGGRQEDDQVIMLNIAMLAFAQIGNERGFLFRSLKNGLLMGTGQSPIVRMTAKEFMFGYETSLTTIGNKVFPNWIKFDRVGLIDRMYDFSEDFETFYTGEEDPSISGLYATYKGSPNLSQWSGEHCSSVHLASDGTKFKSYIKKDETILFFRKSMCRPQRLVRDSEEQRFGSMTGYTYVFEKNSMDNGINETKNQCFCREGYCQPKGLLDVTDCYYGFPISLSYPHFFDGDEDLIRNVSGLSPNTTKHSSYFNVQPQSGLPLSLSAKVQINMHMRNVDTMAKMKYFSYTTIPMLWFDILIPLSIS